MMHAVCIFLHRARVSLLNRETMKRPSRVATNTHLFRKRVDHALVVEKIRIRAFDLQMSPVNIGLHQRRCCVP
jgi:hypothetical protein